MGRPRQFDRPASNRLTVRVTDQQRHDLEQVAKDNRQRLSGVIRDAVNTYVADYREQAVFRPPRPR